MKLKHLSIAIGASLYAMGVGAAVQSSTPMGLSSSLKPLTIDHAQIIERNKIDQQRRMQFSATNSRLKSSALNRQIQRLKPEDKIKLESGLQGDYVYIVELKGSPVATYLGGTSGYPATALGANKNNAATQSKSGLAISKASPVTNKLYKASVASSGNISKYRSHLLEEQNQFVGEAANLGVPLTIRKHFTVTLNGFTAKMTQDEALQLAKSSQVAHIQRSIVHKLDTDVGPQKINADQLWDGSATTDGTPYKGEGQIIGMIDTGINTDHVSFADVGDDGYDHTNPLGSGNYLGQCAQPEFADRCNDKLIGVYTWDVISDMYSSIFFQDGYPDNPPRYEWQFQQIRPIFGEDYVGHGSHTSSTVAGNVINNAPFQFPSYVLDPNKIGNSGDGRDTGLTRKVSGVAPHSNIIMYQACWGGDGETSPYYGCPTEATLESIEQAVLDGVDVINYSISGYGFPWDDAIEQAFYSAYAAGISVAAAAGNFGSYSPANHNSPWLMSVAALYHDRIFEVEPKYLNNMSGGDTTPPADIEGSAIGGSITGEIVLGESFGDKTCDTAFPAGTFTNSQIVVCERSDQPRVNKAANVQAGGGGGMVLYNKDQWGTYGQEVQDMYPIPTIHITANEAAPLLTWLATGSGHMGTITASAAVATMEDHPKTRIASFTSTAPNPTFDGTISPSIGAPGVDILAAYSDDQPFTKYPEAMDWNVISGTSMASPHVAGALALIRQAHPEWSVSEVQSAAQMTANPNIDDGTNDSDPYFHSGTGLIDVAAAVNTGFVLDENAENMRLANPNNSGDPTTLNLPTLVNTHCKSTCSWIRTIKATRDGHWSVDASANHDQVSIKITAEPSQFTLKAGESRSVVVTANILDAAAKVGSTEDPYLFGDVRFTAQESDIPDVQWPVKMKFSRGGLPKMVHVVAHRDNGKYTLKNIPVQNVDTLTGRAFKNSEAHDMSISLEQDDDYTSPIFDDDFNGAVVKWIDVPAGSKRFYAETLERLGSDAQESYLAGDLDVFVGQDTNEDGVIDFDTETICWSYSATEKDFCSLKNPEAGKYWIIFHNYRHSWQDVVTDNYRVAWGVVSNEVDSNISVTSQSVIDPTTQTVDVDIDWNFDQFNQGDNIFTAIDLGTSDQDAGNLALIPVNINRGINDVSMKSSQDQVRSGDVIDVKVHVLPNLNGSDRSFTLSSQIPTGLHIVPGSVMVNNHRNMDSTVEVDGNQLTISGTQPNSSDWARLYNITTNDDDAMCKMPLSDDGGYINLADLGMEPMFGGHANDSQRFRFKDFFQTEDVTFAPYNNAVAMPYSSINIGAMGYVQFDDMTMFFPNSYPFSPDTIWLGGIPDTMIAPLFRGSMFGGALGVPYNNPPWWDTSSEPSGVTVAYNDGPGETKALVVEWDNAQTESTQWDPVSSSVVYTPWGDSYDFESYIAMEYDFGDDKHEIVMAYDNLTFADENNLPVPPPALMSVQDGSIGVYGFYGPRDVFGPTYGILADQFIYGDIDQHLHNGLIVCYDYTGPEASQFDVSFQLQADNTITGRTSDIIVTSDIDGLAQTSTSIQLMSPSNIHVGAIQDQITDEDTELQGVQVLYTDSDPVSNTISASGDHVTVVVFGNGSGATLDITPDANFSGETVVNVTVADNNVATDAATTSFNLTVNAVEDAPIAVVAETSMKATEGDVITLDGSASSDPDGDMLQYSWSGDGDIADPTSAVTTVSGLSVGDHTFTLSVSDGTMSSESEVQVTVSAKAVASNNTSSSKSGGGSMGIVFLMALLGLYRRNRV